MQSFANYNGCSSECAVGNSINPIRSVAQEAKKYFPALSISRRAQLISLEKKVEKSSEKVEKSQIWPDYCSGATW